VLKAVRANAKVQPRYLLTDGRTVFFRDDGGDVVDLLREHQAAFALFLEPLPEAVARRPCWPAYRAGVFAYFGQTMENTPSLFLKVCPNGRFVPQSLSSSSLRQTMENARFRSKRCDERGHAMGNTPFCSPQIGRRGQTMENGPTSTRHARTNTGGDGGGSNSPSKALDRIAPTSVVGDLQSRGPGRAPTRFRSRQPVDLWSAYRAISGPQPRKFRPPRSAGRRPGGRSLTRQRVRKRCCQLPGAVRIYEGERRSSARSDTFACPVETTHPRDPFQEHLEV